jgi:Amt family ammonium transporter
MVYQLMFAAITPALISGSIAERISLRAYVVFVLLWSTLVYDPIAHWLWQDDGWLHKLGALDFAGGMVVHVSSGLSALVFALMLGKRTGYPHDKPVPHDLTMTLLGAGLLWFGWFGFNGGSASGANAIGVLAVVNSQLAACAGGLAWFMLESWRLKKGSSLGFASGFVAGLATVTPTAGYIGPMSGILVGLAAGSICYLAVLFKERMNYDDSLDAFGVHGVGVFASLRWNPDGARGLISGHFEFFGHQVIAAGATVAYSVVMTFVLVKILDVTMGIRVTREAEGEGLDFSLHGEVAYSDATHHQPRGL